MPAEFLNLSLPPWARYDVRNMFLSMLIPSSLTTKAQRKYFEHVCRVDFNPAATKGVMGPAGPCKLVIFGISLDLKGREKFQDQKSIQSYNGCSTCRVVYDSGPHKGLTFSVSRRFLPRDHHLRQATSGAFEFGGTEERSAPIGKDTEYVLSCATYAAAQDIEHFLGQKGLPMFASLVGFNYERSNIADWMHNLARVFVNVLSTVVGAGGQGWAATHYGKDQAHREECMALGIFATVWPDKPMHLAQVFVDALSALEENEINREGQPWLKRWLRRCGSKYSADTGLGELRARVCALAVQAAAGTPIVVSVGKRPLPWRLSKRVLMLLDQRTLNIVYPRYTPSCSRDGQSFWLNPNRVWRTADKIVAFLVIMPTSMRGCGLPVRIAIRRLVYGLRLLEGQCVSETRALALHVEPGSRPLHASDVQKARLLIAEGLSYLHGSVPPSAIVPASHCLLHYADYAATHGVLKWYWLMSFERFNKAVKNSVGNKNHPMASAAASHVRTASARHADWCDASVHYAKPKCCCRGRGISWIPEGAELADLVSDIGCDCCTIQDLQHRTMQHSGADVLGRRFTAGEPLRGVHLPHYHNMRCGSVATAVIEGRSQYGLIERFISCSCAYQERRHYAVLKWFSTPEYPDGDPLLVRVDTRADPAAHLPRAIPLNDLDPSRVLFEQDGQYIFMV